LLYAENKEWKINADGKNLEMKSEDSNFACLYFTYTTGANKLTIAGTYAISEFHHTSINADMGANNYYLYNEKENGSNFQKV